MVNRKRWIISAALLLVVANLSIWRIWFPGQAFDPVAWQSEDKVQKGVRLGMADRLVAQGTLRGKSRAEVVELLGEPPPTEYFRNWDIVYWLGPERGLFSIDSEWLVLRLDQTGRMADYRIVRD